MPETPIPREFGAKGMSTMTDDLPAMRETQVVAKAQRRRITGAEGLRVLRVRETAERGRAR